MKFFERVRVATATTGTGAIAIGAAMSPNFLTFSEAGATDGDVTIIVIEDGADFAVEYGTLGSSVSAITRGAVLYSKISGVAGTSRLSLSGAAEVKAGVSADELNAMTQRQIGAASDKATPIDADWLGIIDSAASNVLKKLTWANLKAAIWVALGPAIAALTGKTTPAGADSLVISDSAAAGASKKLTFTNLWATIAAALAAAQSDQEAGSSNAVFVTPGRQQFHPSAAKFWAKVGVSGGVPLLLTSYNVTSITDVDVGWVTFTIATDFSSENWVPTLAALGVGAVTSSSAILRVNAIAAGTLSVLTTDTTGTLRDPVRWFVSGYGDQ